LRFFSSEGALFNPSSPLWKGTRIFAALALASCLAAGGAEAQPNTAMLRYESGSRLYSMRRYVEAGHEFEAACSLSRQAALLFNVGRAWEGAGAAAQALDAFVRFEAAGAPGYDPSQLRERIARLRAQLSAASSQSSTGAPRGCGPSGCALGLRGSF